MNNTHRLIRLAAFDLDQTLIGDDLVLSPRLREAIAQAQERGVIITLVTGRGPLVTTRFARDLRLSAPVVCYQGGLVYEFHAGQALHEVRLEPAMLPRIVAAMHRHGWNLHFEVSGRLYLPQVSNHPPLFFDLIRVAEWRRVADFLQDLPAAPHKFLVTLNHPGEREQVMEQMLQAFDGQVSIVPSHPYLVEGLPQGVDKGKGLAWLAEFLQVPRAEVLAVGDNDNDAPMIAWAGTGVAVGNASPAARAAADWIAPPLAEDGAAATIEKYLLGG